MDTHEHEKRLDEIEILLKGEKLFTESKRLRQTQRSRHFLRKAMLMLAIMTTCFWSLRASPVVGIILAIYGIIVIAAAADYFIARRDG